MTDTSGTFTINPSGPGVLAGSSVTDAQCTATSNITIGISTKSVDAQGSFNDVIVVAGSGAFTVTCSRPQLITTLTGHYRLINT